MSLKFMLAVLVAIMLIAPTGCSSGGDNGAAPEMGKPAPDFKLARLDGQTVSLSSLSGQPVMLNFWATWCQYCRAEMPFLEELHRKWSAQGLVLVGIDVGESQGTVADYMKASGLSFTVLLDKNKGVALQYRVPGLPTTYFIDKNGIIREIKIGAFTGMAQLENTLKSIMP